MTKEQDDFRKKIDDFKAKEEEKEEVAHTEYEKMCEEAKKKRELADVEAKATKEKDKVILKKYDDLLKPFFIIIKDEYACNNDAVLKSELLKDLPQYEPKPYHFYKLFSDSPEVEEFTYDGGPIYDNRKYQPRIHSPLSYHIEMKWDYNDGNDPQGSSGHVVFPHYERKISITICIDYIDPISKKLVKNGNLIVNASECSGIITLLHKRKPLFSNKTLYYYRKERADWKVKVSLNDPDWQEKITDEILRQLSE